MPACPPPSASSSRRADLRYTGPWPRHQAEPSWPADDNSTFRRRRRIIKRQSNIARRNDRDLGTIYGAKRHQSDSPTSSSDNTHTKYVSTPSQTMLQSHAVTDRRSKRPAHDYCQKHFHYSRMKASATQHKTVHISRPFTLHQVTRMSVRTRE